MIDLANAVEDQFKTYDGANGIKKSILYNGERYMVKFPPSQVRNGAQSSYANSCISEHVASSIFNLIGVQAQETYLAKWNINSEEKTVVACKDFENDGFRLQHFIGIRNLYGDIDHDTSNGLSTELSDILNTIEREQLMPQREVLERFWDMFAVDALVGNFDRHNGNWGLLTNVDTKQAKLAPVFDNGSCLYPHPSDEELYKILQDQIEIDNRIYVFPRSAIKVNNEKINYVDFLSSTENQDCLKSLEKVYENTNLEQINSMISACEISDVRKEFYMRMVKERSSKVLEHSLKINPNVHHIHVVQASLSEPKLKRPSPAELGESAREKTREFNEGLSSNHGSSSHGAV